MNERQAGLATQFDLCQAVAGDWAGFSRDFARSWVQWLTLPEEQRRGPGVLHDGPGGSRRDSARAA
ncbi:MAG: hypothetical protein ABW123_19010, partial [Cystobacter sp.]